MSSTSQGAPRFVGRQTFGNSEVRGQAEVLSSMTIWASSEILLDGRRPDHDGSAIVLDDQILDQVQERFAIALEVLGRIPEVTLPHEPCVCHHWIDENITISAFRRSQVRQGGRLLVRRRTKEVL